MKYRSAILFFIALAFTGLNLQGFVHPAAGLAAEYRIGAVTANVNLRKTPSLQGDVVAGLLKGLPVKVYGEKDGWYRVSAKKNHMLFNGWVYNRYVEIVSAETGPVLPEVRDPKPLPPAPSEKPLPAPVQTSPPPEPAARSQPPVVQTLTREAAPEPAKTDAAMAPERKVTAEKTSSPAAQKQMPAPSPEKSAAPAANPKSTDTARLLLYISSLVLAIIALLIAARAFKAARTSAPVAEPAAEPAAECLPVDTPPITPAKPPVQERRHAPRLNRLIEVDFAVGGKFFRGFITNLSETGVSIDTPETFTVGQEIIISCPAIDTGGYAKRVGLIVRLTETSIAVHFQINS
jgi:hypothetical protein